MKIYALSDTHFGHDKLVELSGRPVGFYNQFLGNMFDMEGDLLIHCGDFCIGDDLKWHDAFMSHAYRFKKKILVRGNHDNKSDAWYYDHGWDFVCESMTNTLFGKKILFTHIPVAKTDKFDFNVHGHMHGNQHRHVEYPYDPKWHRDLAPELNGYKPINLDKFLSTLKEQI